MQVETFEVIEQHADGHVDNPEEIKAIAEKLGCDGQLEILGGDQKAVFPYRKMTNIEHSVYSVICPTETEFKKYKDGIIPLRVMQVAAHVMETGHCHRLEVWHPTSADIKDPVLVGLRYEDPNATWRGVERFILARWGETLDSFEELQKKAFRIASIGVKAKLTEILAEVQEKINNVELYTEAEMLKGRQPSPSFSS